jgi:hypothetical protein
MPPPALRISLGAASNRAELAEGMRLLASALRVPAARRQIV